MITARELLGDVTYTREEIDRFLNPHQSNIATFDAELGYIFCDSRRKDGIDGSYSSIHCCQGTKERKMVNYAIKECRINTYGNSFTQCSQVNDGETWQEYLAAHFGEPIRNFGVGGHGVYQAYRRMLREERTARSAKYVILNIFFDDHFRSLDAWRWIRIPDFRDKCRKTNVNWVHCNPWPHICINPETGEVIEYENPYPTPESLYILCDKDYVYETFKDDFVVQVLLAQENGNLDNLNHLRRMAETLKITGDFANPLSCRKIVKAVYLECALRASKYVVEKMKNFAEKESKKLMILLSYGAGEIIDACKDLRHPNRAFVHFLKKNNIPFVDTLEKHLEDFRCFHLSTQQYVKRYYIGHYSPLGNHFFAFVVKDALVGWLDPKPITYRNGKELYAKLVAGLA